MTLSPAKALLGCCALCLAQSRQISEGAGTRAGLNDVLGVVQGSVHMDGPGYNHREDASHPTATVKLGDGHREDMHVRKPKAGTGKSQEQTPTKAAQKHVASEANTRKRSNRAQKKNKAVVKERAAPKAGDGMTPAFAPATAIPTAPRKAATARSRTMEQVGAHSPLVVVHGKEAITAPAHAAVGKLISHPTRNATAKAHAKVRRHEEAKAFTAQAKADAVMKDFTAHVQAKARAAESRVHTSQQKVAATNMAGHGGAMHRARGRRLAKVSRAGARAQLRSTLKQLEWFDSALTMRLSRPWLTRHGVPLSLDTRKARGSNMTLEWKLEEVEAGSNATLTLHHGCSLTKAKTNLCAIDLGDDRNAARIVVALGRQLGGPGRIVSTFRAKVLGMKFDTTVDCHVCGEDCQTEILGQTFVSHTGKCPIPAGQWVLDLPFSKLGIRDLPVSASVEMHVQLLRGDGSTVFKFMSTATF